MLPLLLLACTSPSDGPDGPADSADTATTSAGCSETVPLDAARRLTTSGVIEGEVGAEVDRWLGVPFAEPPVGDLRFAFPAPRGCVDGEVLDARAMGPVCPQVGLDGGVKGEEDCLQLNVWAPMGATDAPLLVYLHGGGNVAGSTSESSDGVPIYDGADLAAATGAVVVASQYRLGALGFLAHPALEAEYGGGAGNLGLRDQLLAVRWARDNAAAFGADPDRLVLFGESAGGQDTCLLTTSPLAEGLLSGAIVESGGCATRTYATAIEEGEAAVDELGCGDAEDVPACLRALPADALAALSEAPISDLGIPGGGGFGPTVDGEVIPGDPEDRIRDGLALDIPRILGTNRDESSQWVGAMDEASYVALVEATFGRYADELLAVYPADAYPSPRWAWIALTTDGSFTCPTRRLARDFAAQGDAPVWRYWFTKVPTGVSGDLYGSWHGLELVYVFQHLDEVVEATGYAPDDADAQVEATFATAWGGFATTGAPPLPDGTWTPYGDGDPTLEIGAEVRMIGDPTAAACNVWDPLLDLLGA